MSVTVNDVATYIVGWMGATDNSRTRGFHLPNANDVDCPLWRDGEIPRDLWVEAFNMLDDLGVVVEVEPYKWVTGDGYDGAYYVLADSRKDVT